MFEFSHFLWYNNIIIMISLGGLIMDSKKNIEINKDAISKPLGSLKVSNNREHRPLTFGKCNKAAQILFLAVALTTAMPQAAKADNPMVYSYYTTTLDVLPGVNDVDPNDAKQTNKVFKVVGGLIVLSYGICGWIGKRKID